MDETPVIIKVLDMDKIKGHKTVIGEESKFSVMQEKANLIASAHTPYRG